MADLKNQPLIRIAIAGNPNTGKTSIFNNMTGARHKVANWPGVTVEKIVGYCEHDGHLLEITDLPGTYSLTAYSMEELIARNFILNEKPDLLIHVIDAANIERNLYLFTQLVEMKLNIVIVLNMWDEVQQKNMKIDVKLLSQLLHVPVIPAVGRVNQGTREILAAAINTYYQHKFPRLAIDYGKEVNEAIMALVRELLSSGAHIQNTRWLALKLLESDEDIIKQIADLPNSAAISEQLRTSQHRIETFYNSDCETIIAERRFGFINGVCRQAVYFPAQKKVSFTEMIDRILTNRVLGFPIFIFFLWLLFQTTFTVGAYPMVGIDWCVGQLSRFVGHFAGAGILNDLLVNGIINGVGSVAIFLPNILILFFGIALMEDTGYMARAAFLMDRVMQTLGLHGKSFIPMIMGFGCNVPAIIATRTLESERDRILTILINPLMSCSARLPVYILFAGTFFSESAAGSVVFSIYAIGILLAMGLGRLFSKSLLKGKSMPFVLELPPYRIPTWKSLFYHMWDRGSIYLQKMGGVILIASIIIWFLGTFPRIDPNSEGFSAELDSVKSKFESRLHNLDETSAQYQAIQEEYHYSLQQIALNQHLEKQKATIIGRLGLIIEPVIQPLGFDWKMGISLITGFVAKEIVVSTLGVLHQYNDELDENDEGLRMALKMSGLTPLSAYAFMVFVLIYTPCLVTVVAIKKETGSVKWMLFSIFYKLILAWTLAFTIYQGGKFIGLG